MKNNPSAPRTRPHSARLVRRELPALVAAALLAGAWPLHAATRPDASEIANLLRSVPIGFEPNRGQFPPDVLYVARGLDGLVRVRTGGIEIAPRRGIDPYPVRFLGAHPAPEVEGQQPQVTVSRYYSAQAGEAAREGVTHSGRVRMKDLYPGVDLVLHGTGGELEYDFEVAPGVDPAQIRYDLAAAVTASIAANGDLLLEKGGRTLRHRAPVAWQVVDGERVPVSARFALEEGEARSARFELGEYDRARALVIDPVLEYSTYLGSAQDDLGGYIGIDPMGNVLIAGTKVDSVAAGPSSPSFAAITKFNPVTKTVLFNTYIGGTGVQQVRAMKMGQGAFAFQAFVAGGTTAADFPNCISASGCPAHHGGEDAFVLRVDTDGALLSSWLIGGTGNDHANGVASDASGNIYVAGEVGGDLATTGGALQTVKPGLKDGFIAKIMTTETAPSYASYIGGSADDTANAIVVGDNGMLYVGGANGSLNFPATTSLPLPGAFVTALKLDNSVTPKTVVLGNTGGDTVNALAAVPFGGVVAVGETTSANFPQVRRIQAPGGGSDAFVTQFWGNLFSMAFSTRIGGAGRDVANGVTVMPGGGLVVTGYTESADFPMIGALDPSPQAIAQDVLPGAGSAFVARVGASGLDFSTYLGGPGVGVGNSIVNDTATSVLVGGSTNSAAFPTVSAFSDTRSGAHDWTLSRITLPPPSNAWRRPDFDLNGRQDILWYNETDGRSAIWLMNGTTRVSSAEIMGPGTGWSVRHVAQLHPDGTNYLVWQHTDGRMAHYQMSGLTPFNPRQLLNAGSGWEVTHTADVTGDGTAELFFRHTDGSAAIWYLSFGNFSSGSTILGPGTGWSLTKTADFNGDNRADLLWTHADGRVAIWTSNGASGGGGLAVGTSAEILGPGTGWSVTHTADLDGNGKADIVWRHTDGSVAVWLMNGATMASGQGLLGPGTGWSVTQAGDFDADRKDDLLFGHTDGRAAIYLMNGLTPKSTAEILGAGGGWTAKRLLDLNGDGRVDIVWQNTDGRTAVWLMNGASLIGSAELIGPGTGWVVNPAGR